MTTESIHNSFFVKLENVNKKLNSYLDEPNEKNIHDIRTSIRRLDSIYSVIPNSSKTKTSDKLIKQFKTFFSLNSKIRDFDIILEKLIDYGHDPESKLVLSLKKKKLERLSKSIKVGTKLSNVKKPKIKLKTKIDSKFEKKVSSLIDDLNKHIPVVISDESKVCELHLLRKIVKKLRYTLELQNSSYENIISHMRELQKFLGDIHDCDIFIWYLQKRINKIPTASSIIDSEKIKRNGIYKKLVFTLSNFDAQKN